MEVRNKKVGRLDLVVCTDNSSTWEVKTGLGVLGQPTSKGRGCREGVIVEE